jgi:hypothetical protein
MLKNKHLKLLFIVIIFNIQSSELYIKIIKENKHTTRIKCDNEKKIIDTKIVVFNKKNCLNSSNKGKYYFYKNGLLQYYSVALQMAKQLSLPFEVIQRIFFYNKPFIFQKIKDPTSTETMSDLKKKCQSDYKIKHEMSEKILPYTSFFETSITVPKSNKTIFSGFNLKKAFYNDKYLIIDYRHQMVNRDGKEDIRQNQLHGFHMIFIYEINELLKSEDHIEIDKSKPFLKIRLPTSRKGFLMELFLLKKNTIIIKDNSNSNLDHYIYIDLNKNQLDLIKDEQIPSTINTEHSNSAIDNSPRTANDQNNSVQNFQKDCPLLDITANRKVSNTIQNTDEKKPTPLTINNSPPNDPTPTRKNPIMNYIKQQIKPIVFISSAVVIFFIFKKIFALFSFCPRMT